MIQNSKGRVFYGLHFYPGLAEYQDEGKAPYRVFLNEDTLRAMDPTFAGRPVFVMHVDGVDDNVDDLRKEADGWVIESFFNQADGKHWVKFLVVSERGEKAIKDGMRLSNCYLPTSSTQGGLWNGIAYAKEITGGEYEHLAIVPNPRYEESVIMTPEQFKSYNENKILELKRLANEGNGMLKLFKRTKVENSVDIEGMVVVLEKSGREVELKKLVNEADEREVAKGKPVEAASAHIVNMGEGKEKMTVGDLVSKHQAMCDELEAYKKSNVDMGGEEAAEEGGDADHELENADDDGDEDDKKKKKENEDKESEKKEKEKKDKKENAAKKAAALRNAQNDSEEAPAVDFSEDKVARGKSRYGS